MPTPLSFSDVLGVEVFRPGTWHGVTYDDADMDRIAENSNAMLPYFQGKLRLSPLKLGHTPEQEVPQFIRDAAFGVATRYYTQVRDGLKRVYADFRNVPKVLAQAIDQFYRNRSVEKYPRFRHPETGEEFRDVISSVAFLGHLPPEVKGMLDDFAVLYQSPQTSTPSVSITFTECVDLPLTHIQENPMAKQVKAPEGEDVTQAASPSNPSVEPDRSSDPVSQSVTVNVPTAFSDEVKAAIREATQDAVKHAEDAFQEQLKAKQIAFQEQLDAAEAENAELKQQNETLAVQNFREKVTSTLDKLSLPPSFRELGIENFMASLEAQTPQQFAETGEQQSQYDCFHAMLQEIAKFWEASQQVLTEEQSPAEPQQAASPINAWHQAVQTYMDSHPNASKRDAMQIVAEAQPDLVKEDN